MQTSELAVLLSGLTIRDPSEYKDLNDIYSKLKFKIKKRNIEKELEYIEKNNIRVISFFDENYPESLRQIYYPPIVLYVKGELKENPLTIAIVGTRYPSGYGQRVAKYLTSYLVNSGFSIVSGLALGIDALAHKTTLENNGYTIAVLGNGLSIRYPEKNRELYEQIEKKGCLVSEFGVFEPPNRYNFPARNRIIAGLSKATAVIEADIKSGSLITARLTIEQGKTVFSVPGEIFSKRSKGTNKLISEGAIPVIDVNTILEHFYIELKEELKEAENPANLNEDEKIVLELMEGSTTEDELAIKSNMEIGKISEILFDLELKGLIKRNDYGEYEKI
ncbi:DNA-processing protein DprA [Hippea alviniae]|uniref:DNA-processing protein DprA n=1 Tax=Hippea alviniae TaxID=1279027 RepID=UPI0004183E35|nr:DNA-processing protein DprA [Hippea alviniae]